MCQPCPRSQLLAVYYEEQQQSRENVPCACPRKNLHIFWEYFPQYVCHVSARSVFCKSQNLRLGTGHSAEKIRTQRIFCCLSFGLLWRRHLLWRHFWQFPKKSYISLISWYRYLSSRDIVWALRTRSGILYFGAAASDKQKTCGCSQRCSPRAAAMPRWRN